MRTETLRHGRRQRRRRWPLALLVLALAGAPRPAQAADPDRHRCEGADGIVETRMQELGLVGVGVALIVDRQLVCSRGYGFADRQRGLPFTPDSVMNIGSISKTFVGVAMMQAVADGRLDLDSDINDYLPFEVHSPYHRDAITLRRLATHTSGITDRWEVYERVYRWDGEQPEALHDFLAGYLLPGGKDFARGNFLDAKPGAHYEYSNIAAALAGYIVEQAVGEGLDRYTQRRIFAPLGMAHSGWSVADVPPGTHSLQYLAVDGFAIPIRPYALVTYPDGGVRTSVADLARFFLALLNDGQYDGKRILPADAAAEMLKFQFTEAGKPDNIDLSEKNSGLFWGTKYRPMRTGHGGFDPGVMTTMVSDLARHVGIIVFSNTSVPERDGKAFVDMVNELFAYADTIP